LKIFECQYCTIGTDYCDPAIGVDPYSFPVPTPPTTHGIPPDGGVLDYGEDPSTPPGADAGSAQDGGGIEQPLSPTTPPDSTMTPPRPLDQNDDIHYLPPKYSPMNLVKYISI
jgi:hypothetical protein